MTRETARRAGQALLWWGVVGGPILAWWPGALRLPALWAVVVLGVLANALQPSYRFRDTARSPEDRGTFRQIMLTVYGSQAAALVELVLRRPPGLPFDALGVGALLAMGAGPRPPDVGDRHARRLVHAAGGRDARAAPGPGAGHTG